MSYEEMVNSLFRILAVANMADHDEAALPWQKSEDASERSGFYGMIAKAVVEIAGREIYENWTKTSEVDMSLANRKSE